MNGLIESHRPHRDMRSHGLPLKLVFTQRYALSKAGETDSAADRHFVSSSLGFFPSKVAANSGIQKPGCWHSPSLRQRMGDAEGLN